MLELDDTEELELTELDEETELLDTEELELILLELPGVPLRRIFDFTNLPDSVS